MLLFQQSCRDGRDGFHITGNIRFCGRRFPISPPWISRLAIIDPRESLDDGEDEEVPEENGASRLYIPWSLVCQSYNYAPNFRYLFQQTESSWHWHRQVEASVATASFVIATFLRTMVMTPLNRLFEGDIMQPRSSSFLVSVDSIIDGMERFAHRVWEDAARQSGVLLRDGGGVDYGRSSPTPRHRTAPEIDLNMLVPCKVDMARKYLLGGRMTTTNDDGGNDGEPSATADRRVDEPPSLLAVAGGNTSSASEIFCRLRNVITRKLLVDYSKAFLDDEFDLATHPIILRNLWPAESFRVSADVSDKKRSSSNNNGDCKSIGPRINRRLTPNAILNDPQLSNLLLPNYFSDAANKAGYAALVPDVADGTPMTLSEFLRIILSGDAPNAKIGTQVIIDEYPELRDEIIPPSLAKELFGWNTHLEDVKMRIGERWLPEELGAWLGKLVPPMTTFPVFIAGNRHSGAAGAGIDGARHPRTDLHAEPIGNIASQLHGARRWTLVPTMWSGLLRPTVSRHRGYFYSNMDPLIELPERLKNIPLVYVCVTRRGDTMWIPPWVCTSELSLRRLFVVFL
jgi:hypothetical protein